MTTVSKQSGSNRASPIGMRDGMKFVCVALFVCEPINADDDDDDDEDPQVTEESSHPMCIFMPHIRADFNMHTEQ